IEKRAEALNKHHDVILREKVIEMLPEFARAVSEPMSNVESIRILGNGGNDNLNSLPNSVTSMMANLQESMGQMTGFNLEHFLQNLSGSNSVNDYKEDVIENVEEVINEATIEDLVKSANKVNDKLDE